MSSIIEIGSTVWLPDDEDMFLPGKVTSIDGDNAVVAVIDSPDDEEITAAVNTLKVCDPASLVQCEDMTLVNDLNEMTILHNLRMRFKKQNIYTSVGQILVAVNPFQLLPIYTPEWIERYKQNGSRGQPPHVYGVADDENYQVYGTTFYSMHETKQRKTR